GVQTCALPILTLINAFAVFAKAVPFAFPNSSAYTRYAPGRSYLCVNVGVVVFSIWPSPMWTTAWALELKLDRVNRRTLPCWAVGDVDCTERIPVGVGGMAG